MNGSSETWMLPANPPDVIELLEAVCTELENENLDGARLALGYYWTHRGPGNGTIKSDLRAFELTRDLIAHTPNDNSRSRQTLKRPRRVLIALPDDPLSGEKCTFHATAGYGRDLETVIPRSPPVRSPSMNRATDRPKQSSPPKTSASGRGRKSSIHRPANGLPHPKEIEH